MKQIISSNKNKTIDILDFAPTFTDRWHEVFIKPIGILDNREGENEKSFFVQSVFERFQAQTNQFTSGRFI